MYMYAYVRKPDIAAVLKIVEYFVF
jgi:hypothetical protein